jgi:hypothetical protein
MKRILAIVCLLAAVAMASAQEWAWPVLARQASKRQSAPTTPYLSDSLSAMWTFNAADWTNANYGLVTGARWVRESAGVAVFDAGKISVTGKTMYVASPNLAFGKTSGTIAMRVRVGTSPGGDYLWINNPGGFNTDYAAHLYASGSTVNWLGKSGNAVQWNGSSAGSTGVWMTTVFTWATNDVRAYKLVDGASVATQVLTDTSSAIAWTGGVFRAFAYNVAGQYSFVGEVDEIRSYNRVVSSNEAVGIAFDMPWGL